MNNYLASTEIIDWDNPPVTEKAHELSQGLDTQEQIAKSCFEWVRDHIKHIGDYDIPTVSITASQVLGTRSGICYAKSHLLAALLRANSIPCGFCYQRLSRDDNGAPYCLHGLNAVCLPEFGWYRIDPRGNREGVNALFTPPQEHLAFSVRLEGEMDFPEILADPLPIIIETLRKYRVKDELWANLPDTQVIWPKGQDTP